MSLKLFFIVLFGLFIMYQDFKDRQIYLIFIFFFVSLVFDWGTGFMIFLIGIFLAIINVPIDITFIGLIITKGVHYPYQFNVGYFVIYFFIVFLMRDKFKNEVPFVGMVVPYFILGNLLF